MIYNDMQSLRAVKDKLIWQSNVFFISKVHYDNWLNLCLASTSKLLYYTFTWREKLKYKVSWIKQEIAHFLYSQIEIFTPKRKKNYEIVHKRLERNSHLSQFLLK